MTETWPQFRGPRGDGHAETVELPIHWSESQNVRWKTPIHGKAWSSPVVWGDRVWVTTATEDGRELSAVAVDRDSGRVLIDVKVFDVAKPQYCHPTNSYASSTPCLEEGRIYVHYGSAGTACLDAADGKTIWARRDLPCNHFRGPASSPVLFGNLLIVNFDGYDQQYVVALDKQTGRTVWRQERAIDYGTDNGDNKKAFSTPAIVDVEGKPQLISPAAAATVAYDPLSGNELWKVYHGGVNAAARPVTGHGRVFICTGDFGLRLLAVRLGGRGDVTKTHLDWKFGRSVPTRSSPLLIGDKLYVISDGGVVSWLEARTGRLAWQERLNGQFSASPLYAGGKIYFFSEDGVGYVADVSQGWKVVATNRLADGCMASPAVAGKTLIVRTRTHLYSIGSTN